MNNKINKEELARIIWASANTARGKITQEQHKNFLLSLIFYKFLSQKQYIFLSNQLKEYVEDRQVNLDDINALDESNFDEDGKNKTFDLYQEGYEDIIEASKIELGYFIKPKFLFENWANNNIKFNTEAITEAIHSFNENLSEKGEIRSLFEGVFNAYSKDLYKLGDSPREATNYLVLILDLIKQIPVDRQDFDVLGFIYQYMIEQFAGEAGKKGGEFFTPSEVSQLMSEIVARHLKHRQNISIYDPTSGSGSLLIRLGDMFAKYSKTQHKVTYYAQELNPETYTMSRMNLIMHGINPVDIHVRNANTLKKDWPFFIKNNDESSYKLKIVDAVVANPPYSISWEPEEAEGDPRFIEYGLAPKSKADYAFVLHSLHHLEREGIMTVVLPHGVLFRGGNEGKIRRKLIENGYIDTIIGLPAGIFFRTGIATIIMVLRKNRKNRDIQFIDGSKLFTKYSSTNRMEVSHIRKIVDAYIDKKDIAKFSKIASFEEIKENDFNLNISRYIDSFEKDDFHDLYASLHGGIPNTELDNFSDFWASMPNIKEILLKPLDAKYSEFKDKENIYQTILDHPDTQAYLEKYSNVVKKLKEFLRQKLGNFNDIKNIRIENLADEFDNFFFDNISQIKMLDKYELYQEAITTFKDIKTDLYNILANIDNQDNHLYFDVFANNLTIEKVYFAN
ncbi:type I restriction-modification system subunit M, partial [Mycoplasma sp. CSL7475-4]|uniref:type I restriction-modification system subunit M n=1 Tax=Mycoplasma sp. CSL7475-4 TaxID=2973942 RepID=UPI00216AE26A